VAWSLALREIVNCVELTKVAVWTTPLRVTVQLETKPVPVIVSVCAATPAVAEVGERLVMAGWGFATATGAEPDLVESSVDVAVMVAVPAPEGVKTPVEVAVPMLAGLTDQVTEEL
jgi:hypothetical protein